MGDFSSFRTRVKRDLRGIKKSRPKPDTSREDVHNEEIIQVKGEK